MDATGREQIRRVAAWLELDADPLALYASPRRRAVESAALIAGAAARAEKEVRIDDRLVELGFGAFEGMTPAEIDAAGWNEIYRAWRQGRPPLYPAGAERFEQAAERAVSFFDDVLARAEGLTIIVGHGHQLRILLAVAILGIDAEAHRRLRLDHGCAAVVEWEGPTPRLAGLNIARFDSSRRSNRHA